MPALRVLELVAATGESTALRRDTLGNAPHSKSTPIWIIIAGVAALLAFGACLALVVLSISKRRLLKRQLAEARQRDPCLEPKEFSKRRRMTRDDLVLQAEEQREAMLRKSLASRSGSMSSRMTFEQMSMNERPETDSTSAPTREYGLDDGRNGEGRLSRLGSVSSLRRERARSMSPFPELPAPTLSRSSSPYRPSLPQVVAGPPPLIEQHPLFQKMSDDSEDEEVRPSLMRSRAEIKEEQL